MSSSASGPTVYTLRVEAWDGEPLPGSAFEQVVAVLFGALHSAGGAGAGVSAEVEGRRAVLTSTRSGGLPTSALIRAAREVCAARWPNGGATLSHEVQ